MKKSILSLIVFLQVIFMFGCSNNQTFNDVTSMEVKIAKELDTEQVSIFDLQDIDEYRFVGYTFDNNQGYAVFKQNEKGNFIFDYIKNSDRMISRAENIFNDNHILYWIVVSTNENLNTIELKIDLENSSDDEIITIEVEDNPSINVIKLPEKNFGGEYNFYDDKGNLIKY